jgi:hypothetical protein
LENLVDGPQLISRLLEAPRQEAKGSSGCKGCQEEKVPKGKVADEFPHQKPSGPANRHTDAVNNYLC